MGPETVTVCETEDNLLFINLSSLDSKKEGIFTKVEFQVSFLWRFPSVPR